MRLPHLDPFRLRVTVIASGAVLGLLASMIGRPDLPPMRTAMLAMLVGAVAGLLVVLIGRPTPRALTGAACGLAVIMCIFTQATPDYSPSLSEYLPSCIIFPLAGALLATASLRGAIVGAGVGTAVAFVILAVTAATYYNSDSGAALDDIPGAIMLALMVGVPDGAVLGGIVDRLRVMQRSHK